MMIMMILKMGNMWMRMGMVMVMRMILMRTVDQKEIELLQKLAGEDGLVV